MSYIYYIHGYGILANTGWATRSISSRYQNNKSNLFFGKYLLGGIFLSARAYLCKLRCIWKFGCGSMCKFLHRGGLGMSDYAQLEEVKSF